MSIAVPAGSRREYEYYSSFRFGAARAEAGRSLLIGVRAAFGGGRQAFTSSRGGGSACKQANGVGVDALGKKCGRHAIAAAVGCMALLGQWQWLSRHVGSCGLPSLKTVGQALTSLPVQAG
jgi:hypothetical protein